MYKVKKLLYKIMYIYYIYKYNKLLLFCSMKSSLKFLNILLTINYTLFSVTGVIYVRYQSRPFTNISFQL